MADERNPKCPSRLDSIQALRGIASISVVLFHSVKGMTLRSPPGTIQPLPIWNSGTSMAELGAAGVDIFFVLSGFLMLHISDDYVARRKSIGDFLAHRAMRIWPPYALVTLWLCISKCYHGSMFDLQTRRLLSLIFVPSFDSEGMVVPILSVGWTLNYEAMFYLVFALTLLIARQHVLRCAATLLFVLFGVGQCLPTDWAMSFFLTQSVMFEFLFGIFIARLLQLGKLPFPRPAIWIMTGIISLAIFGGPQWIDPFRVTKQGLSATLIVIGFVHTEHRMRWPRWMLRLGDASYSIYLIHMLVVYKIVKLFWYSISHSSFILVIRSLCVCASISLSIVAGLLAFRFIEAPMLRLLNTTYRSRFHGELEVA